MTSWYDVAVLVGSRAAEADTSLLVRLAAGEASALRSVYREHNEVVRAFARRLVGNEADAEELVQEVFISLPAAARHCQGVSSLRTFTLGIAANHARHFVRAAARRRAASQRYAREPLPESAPADEQLQRGELFERLLWAMDQLSHDQRVVFVLCEVEERSSDEAATILGEPSSTLRARLGAARRKLRELLREERT